MALVDEIIGQTSVKEDLSPPLEGGGYSHELAVAIGNSIAKSTNEVAEQVNEIVSITGGEDENQAPSFNWEADLIEAIEKGE